jgi:DNA polymerase (family 10)
VENAEVAQVFRELADLLEIRNENVFRIRAYRRAAETIDGLPEGLGQILDEGRLREIPGFGEAIAAKITELLSTGQLKTLERLRAELNQGTPS